MLVLAAVTAIFSTVKSCRTKNPQPENAEPSPMIRTVIRDTVSVVEHAAYTATEEDAGRAADDKRMMKDVGLKARQIKSLQTTSLQTTLDVPLPVQEESSVSPDSIRIPLSWSYHDRWTDVSFSDTTLHIATRDSVTTIVYREFKHRFLWWRWGTKAIRVKLLNFNPHSTIVYDRFVKMEE